MVGTVGFFDVGLQVAFRGRHIMAGRTFQLLIATT